MMFICVFIVQFIAVRSQHVLHYHISSGASLVVKIDNSNLIHRFLFDILYHPDFKKEDLSKLKIRKDKVDFVPTGININREIILFHEEWGDKSIIGILMHVSDEKKFNNFVVGESNAIKVTRNNIGCILLLPEECKQEDSIYFVDYANDLLIVNPDRTKSRLFLSKSSDKNIFHLYFEGEKDAFMQDISLEAFLDDNTLTFKGAARKNPTFYLDSIPGYYFKAPPIAEHLEIGMGKLPDTVNNYIKKMLAKIDVETPDFSAQQLFIYGFEISDFNKNISVFPLIDGIFKFQDTINFKGKTKDVNLKNIEKSNTTLKIGPIEYYFEQLSPTEVYLGVNKTPPLIKKNHNRIFYIEGNLDAVLNFSGQGFIAQIARLFPPVQHSKNLFNSLKSFNIEANVSTPDSIYISGEMAFPKNKTASVEILKYLLKF